MDTAFYEISKILTHFIQKSNRNLILAQQENANHTSKQCQPEAPAASPWTNASVLILITNTTPECVCRQQENLKPYSNNNPFPLPTYHPRSLKKTIVRLSLEKRFSSNEIYA
ncbi:hypothetical protein CEXT_642611 [Caerostris extrusa]|uniref:Uncharacterized protein n=1 Tax=Caerostris extrusa TaxID=172846 RepID=A0AAV4S2H6_CAEEX|nr:hypothetical protein CEXT_642611 [Caerostris extrusa]